MTATDPTGALLSETRVAAAVGDTITEMEDAPGDFTSPYRIIPGEIFAGEVESVTDRDYVGIELIDDFDYIIRVTHDRLTPPPDGYELGLWNAALTSPFPRESDTSLAGSPIEFIYDVSFTGGSAGLHFISVENATTLGGPFNYQITVEEDIGQSVNTGGRIAVGETVADAIELVNDRDWYQTELTTGNSYAFVLRPTDTATPGERVELELRTAEVRTVARGATFPDDSTVLQYDPGETGIFYIEADDSTKGSTDFLGGYELTLIEEILASTATNANLDIGGSYDGAYEYYGDQDWVGVTLTAGQQYRFELVPSNVEGTPLPRLALRDPAGGYLADTGDIEMPGDGVLLFTATETGRHFLHAFASASDIIADYTLTASEVEGPIEGTPNADVLSGTVGDDTILGLGDNDRLLGEAGNDSLDGGLGSDTLNGGDGNDTIVGGPGESDLRDVVFAGSGDDTVDGGAGNDLIFGQDGNDTIAGGAGVDELQGQDGDDVITGSNFSDLVFGGAGNDFVNGGFGSDRINGGSGADKFFHAGVLGHGSDWVQDYVAADGDVLLWGGGPATADDFQVNFAHTANDAGERSGDDTVQEGFVIYKPTEQIIWALVDGGGQSSINLQIGGDTFDLLA